MSGPGLTGGIIGETPNTPKCLSRPVRRSIVDDESRRGGRSILQATDDEMANQIRRVTRKVFVDLSEIYDTVLLETDSQISDQHQFRKQEKDMSRYVTCIVS